MTVYPIMKGGLGNQLFVYAMARAHALRTHSRLLLNIGNFAHDTQYERKYALGIFAINPEVDHKSNSPLNEFLSRHNQRWRRLLGFFRQEDPSIGCNALPLHWIWRLNLNGYWQSERYFDQFADTIYADLQLRNANVIKNSAIGRMISSEPNSVMVHVRSFHDAVGCDCDAMTLPIQYYENSFVYLTKHCESLLHAFLFSDEPDFAEQRIQPVAQRLGIRLTVVRCCDIASPGADLQLMRMCRHAIVGNSSFSWWGAWLGEQDNKVNGRSGVVVCPEGTPFPGANRDFYPKRWPRISRLECGHSEYDVIIPFGTDCSVAFQLRHRGLRMFSLPFDWVKMEGEKALEYLAVGLKDRFKNLCLRENLIHSEGRDEECYFDTATNFNFLHLFKESIDKSMIYECGYNKLRERINRFYHVIEQSDKVLFVSALEQPISDTILIKLIQSVKDVFPGKIIDFKFLQFQADHVTEQSRLDCVVNIYRSISDYDMKYTTIEWRFLDKYMKKEIRFRWLLKCKYKLHRSCVKALKSFGIGSMSDFL